MISLNNLLPTPSLLAAPLRALPDSITHKPIATVLNRLFEQSIDDGEFDFLEGRWVKLDITDAKLQLCLSFDGNKLITASRPVSDVVFKGDTKSCIALALRQEDPDTLFFQRKLMIEGDTELGLALKNLLDSIDHDQFPALAKAALSLGQKVSTKFKH